MEEQSDLSSSSLPLHVKKSLIESKISNSLIVFRISLYLWEAKSTGCSFCALGSYISPQQFMDTSCQGDLMLYQVTQAVMNTSPGLFIVQRWNWSENCQKPQTWTWLLRFLILWTNMKVWCNCFQVHQEYLNRIHDRCFLHHSASMLREAVNLVLNLGVELRDATLSDLPIHTRTLLAWEEKYARCHTFLASTLQVCRDSWAFAPAEITFPSLRLWPAEERFPILRDSLWHCYIVVRPRAILLGLPTPWVQINVVQYISLFTRMLFIFAMWVCQIGTDVVALF